MKLQLQVSKQDFYSKYYQAINGILKLTSKELVILTVLSNKKLTGITDKELFSSKSRKEMCDALAISKFNFNNYIKSMADRGILSRKGRDLAINPAIYKDITGLDNINFTFTFNIHG